MSARKLVFGVLLLGAFIELLAAQPVACQSPTTISYPSKNCRGTPTRRPFFGGHYCDDTCDVSPAGHGSLTYSCNLGHIAYTEFSYPNCMGPYTTTSVITQECINLGTTSLAVVCKDTDRVYPAKTQDSPLIADGLLHGAVQCTAPYYCTPNVPFVTYFRDPQCQGPASVSYEVYGGARLNKCYLDEQDGINVKMTCERSTLTIRAYASGCANPEYARTQLSSSECFFDQSGRGYKFFCGSTTFNAERDQFNATDNADAFQPSNKFDFLGLTHKYLEP